MDITTKINTLDQWIKKLTWEEDGDRTDARLMVVVSPFVVDDDPSSDVAKVLLECTKSDYIAFVESLCTERIDSFTIDSINITMDGDRFDTTITINAEIHLSE